MFFPKFSEGKEWCDRVRKIYTALHDRYINGSGRIFPVHRKRAQFGSGCPKIQDQCLTTERGMYYTTTTTADLVGREAKRQLDLFNKRRTGNVDMAHKWKDVRVIGQHRVSDDWKDKYLQFASVHNITWNPATFNSLALAKGREDKILALVNSRTNRQHEPKFDDVVIGKGQGLIMLLR